MEDGPPQIEQAEPEFRGAGTRSLISMFVNKLAENQHAPIVSQVAVPDQGLFESCVRFCDLAGAGRLPTVDRRRATCMRPSRMAPLIAGDSDAASEFRSAGL